MKSKQLLLFLLLFLLACQTFSPISTPLTPIALSDITFEDTFIQERMVALDHCITEIASDSDWRYVPYTSGGAFITARWCQGTGASSDCQITSANQDQRDQHDFELYTLHFGDDPTHAFGLGLSALWVPSDTGWGVVFSFSEGGRTIVGEGFTLSFSEYDNTQEEPVNRLIFGMDNAYKVGETTLTYPAQHPLRDELALYLASPDSLLAQGQTVLNGLAETVETALNAHTTTTCNYGPYEGNGIPPACNPRPLTTEEEQTAQKEAEQYFANQEKVLAENYGEMYDTLQTAFPFEACWPEK